MYQLTEAKRNNNPLVAFVACYFNDLRPGLSASSMGPPVTHVRHVFYNSASFVSYAELMHAAGGDTSQLPPHLRSVVVWNSELFAVIGARVIRQLQHQASELSDSQVVSPPAEPSILVAFALARLMFSFRFFLKTLLEWDRVHDLVKPFGFVSVAVRTANDCTGPSFKYCYYIRHPRQAGYADQHIGLQADPKLEYVMYTRPQEELVVFLHDSHGLPGRRIKMPDATSEGSRRIQTCIDTIEKLGTDWVAVALGLGTLPRTYRSAPREDCLWPNPNWGISNSSAMDLATQTASWLLSQPWDIVAHASMRNPALVLDDMLDEMMRSSFSWSSLRRVKEETRRVNQHLERRKPHSFGKHSLPANPADLLLEQPAMALKELEWMCRRMINVVTVIGFGKDSALIAIPTIFNLPGVPNMAYNLHNETDACWALRIFVYLVWAILRAATGVSLQVASVSHKANIKEGEGTIQWVKHCSSNREAVVLAEHFQVIGQIAGEIFCLKPRRAPLYTYVGGGFEEQPVDVSTIVVKCHLLQMAASVLNACALITGAANALVAFGLGRHHL